MPEEVENLEDTNNEEGNAETNVDASSKSPLKDVAGNVASNIVDFNKYKSRKKNKANIDPDSTKNNAGNSLKSSLLNKGNGAVNGLKNKAGNAMLDKVSNAHPALKALSVLNNLNNTRKKKKANKTGIIGGESQNTDNNDNNDDSAATNNDSSATSSTNFSEGNEEGGTNSSPLNRIFGNDVLAGKFSFLGKIPKAIKYIAMLASPIITLFILCLPIILIIAFFSSLFGADKSLASETGGGVGNINYGDYELSSDGDEILNQSLDVFLESRGSNLEEFNNLIASNVEDSGYGTRAGVVASAVTLIAELGDNYNVKIPYFWGGGHGTISEGAESNWGSGRCFTTANGHAYTLCGLDCSGFVTWAIYNGGYNITPLTTGSFQNLPGAEHVTLQDSAILEPGDLLESNSHVVLVVGVDEDNNEYICAEASGRTTGVLFTRRAFTRSGYWGVKMDGFYNTQARS